MRLITKHKIVNILTAIFFTNAMVMPIAQPIAYAEEVVAEATNATSATDNLSTGTSGTTNVTTNGTATESSGTTQSDATNVPSQEKIESGIQTYLENFDKWSADDKAKFAEKYGEYIYTLYRENSTEGKQTYIDKLKNAQTVTEAKAILEEGTTYTTNNIPSAEWTRQLSNWNKLSEFDRMNVLKERINDIDKEGLLSKAGVDNELIKKVIDSSGFTVKQLDNFITDYIKAQTQVNETSTTAETKKCPTGYFEVADVGKCCPNGSYFDSETQMCKTDGDSSSSSDGRSGGGSNIMSGILPLAGILMKGGFGGNASTKAGEDPVPPETKEKTERMERSSVDGKYKNALKKGDIQITPNGTAIIDGKEDYLYDSSMNSVVYSSHASDKQYLVLTFSSKNGKRPEIGEVVIKVEAMPNPVTLYEDKTPIPNPIIKEQNNTVVKRFLIKDVLLQSTNKNGYDITVIGNNGKFQLPIKGAIKVLDSELTLGKGKSGASVATEVYILDGADDKNLIDFEDGDVIFEADSGICSVKLKNGKRIKIKAEDFSSCENELKELKGRYYDDAQVKEDGTITARNINDFKTNEEMNRDFQIKTKDGVKSIFTADMTAFVGPDGKGYFLDVTTGKTYKFTSPPEEVKDLEITTEIKDDGNYIIKDKKTGEVISQTSTSEIIRISKTEPPAETGKEPENGTAQKIEPKNRNATVVDVGINTFKNTVGIGIKNNEYDFSFKSTIPEDSFLRKIFK